jgi:hypothetical protein
MGGLPDVTTGRTGNNDEQKQYLLQKRSHFNEEKFRIDDEIS